MAKYDPTVMAVYRKHPGGIWSSLSFESKLLWNISNFEKSIKFYHDNVLRPKLIIQLREHGVLLLKSSIKNGNVLNVLKALRAMFNAYTSH